MMHSARAFGATPLNVGNVRTNYREIAPVVVAAALHHPQRGQVLQSFDGVMIEYGWRIMFQSDKPVNCKLTFKVHEDGVERIDIRGGVSDNIKKAKNLFAIHELNRVVYYSTEQISGERQPPAQAYTLYFDLRVSTFFFVLLGKISLKAKLFVSLLGQKIGALGVQVHEASPRQLDRQTARFALTTFGEWRLRA